jgi:hypothetical protein
VSVVGNFGGANVTASANIGIFTNSGLGTVAGQFFRREECSNFGSQVIPCVDIDDTIVVNGYVRANDSNQILLSVEELGSDNRGTNVDVLASADPIIQIADALIPGGGLCSAGQGIVSCGAVDLSRRAFGPQGRTSLHLAGRPGVLSVSARLVPPLYALASDASVEYAYVSDTRSDGPRQLMVLVT